MSDLAVVLASEARRASVLAVRRSRWASSFFVRNLKLQRWTAQKVLATLAERGLLERRGTTAGTRYRLLHSRRLIRETSGFESLRP